MDEFLIKTRQSAMEAEEGTKARTVVPPNPNTDDDVWSSFKSTVYTKGACMVRMIHGICGEKAFKLALKVKLKYIKICLVLGFSFLLRVSNFILLMHRKIVLTAYTFSIFTQ